MSSVLYFPAWTNVNVTVQPNCADVPLRISRSYLLSNLLKPQQQDLGTRVLTPQLRSRDLDASVWGHSLKTFLSLRIRGFGDYVLHKSTFYLLYLQDWELVNTNSILMNLCLKSRLSSRVMNTLYWIFFTTVHLNSLSELALGLIVHVQLYIFQGLCQTFDQAILFCQVWCAQGCGDGSLPAGFKGWVLVGCVGSKPSEARLTHVVCIWETHLPSSIEHWSNNNANYVPPQPKTLQI